MKFARTHRWASLGVLGTLVVVAVIVSSVRGSAPGAVLAALVGALIMAYFVRHEMRTRPQRDRREAVPGEVGRPQSAGHRSQPAPTSLEVRCRTPPTRWHCDGATCAGA